MKDNGRVRWDSPKDVAAPDHVCRPSGMCVSGAHRFPPAVRWTFRLLALSLGEGPFALPPDVRLPL